MNSHFKLAVKSYALLLLTACGSQKINLKSPSMDGANQARSGQQAVQNNPAQASSPQGQLVSPFFPSHFEDSSVAEQRVMLRQALLSQNVLPLNDSDFRQHSPAKISLGRMLFFDRILSGNRKTSCASCHLFNRGSSDNFSMTIDAATRGLVRRFLNPSTSDFVPRNTMNLANVGHKSFNTMFHDSRIEVDPTMPSGIRTPAGAETPEGLDSVVAAQALFPMLADIEMLGKPGENDLSSEKSPAKIWRGLLLRVLSISEYRRMFAEVYPGIAQDHFGIEHVANAIAAFEETIFRSNKSAFDGYLNGNESSLTNDQVYGALLFYGKFQCSSCHAGSLQTNHLHSANAMPQIGPGKKQGIGGMEDFGRGGITKNDLDRYLFKVPTLRNVEVTGPYGHDGAYESLEDMIRHYRDPVASLMHYTPRRIKIPSVRYPEGFFAAAYSPQIQKNIAAANKVPGMAISDSEVQFLKAFLVSLTDARYINEASIRPRVPSGLNDRFGRMPDFNFPLNKNLFFSVIPENDDEVN